jgi:pilus assembly protein Flp/PilA
MTNHLKKGGGLMLFHKKERGQGMVEYALIILLIAMVVIAILTFFGTQLSTTFSKIANNPAWGH